MSQYSALQTPLTLARASSRVCQIVLMFALWPLLFVQAAAVLQREPSLLRHLSGLAAGDAFQLPAARALGKRRPRNSGCAAP